MGDCPWSECPKMTYGSDEWERAVLAEHGCAMPDGHALRVAAARLARTLDDLATGAQADTVVRAPDYVFNAYRVEVRRLRAELRQAERNVAAVRMVHNEMMARLRFVCRLDARATEADVVEVVKALAGGAA